MESVRRGYSSGTAIIGNGGNGVACLPGNDQDVKRIAASPSVVGLMRPSVDEDAADKEIITMMTKCWAEDPLDRPDFTALKVTIRKLNKYLVAKISMSSHHQ